MLTRRASIGVTIGKFNPPHLGHLYLIQQAASQVEQLFVVLCARAGQTISGEERLSWLQDAAPSNTTVIITSDDLAASSEPWARRVLDIVPVPPDLAFTSEAWGPEWAALMGAEHVLVDSARITFPISATKIRADLGSNFQWLVPAARIALARRVVLVGAESTGKSTMAESLARELGTVWVPEHGRWYWEGRRYLEDQSWTSDEFRRIAGAQHRLAEDLARRASRGVVVLDTDALVTAVWHERYLGCADRELEAILPKIAPDLYLVCCPDFEWVQDGTRESDLHRASMHEAICSRALASGRRVEMLRGSHEDRLARALDLVRPLSTFPKLL
jgi:NadR type nicotinamide-nucleotide adenylyltransferase